MTREQLKKIIKEELKSLKEVHALSRFQHDEFDSKAQDMKLDDSEVIKMLVDAFQNSTRQFFIAFPEDLGSNAGIAEILRVSGYSVNQAALEFMLRVDLRSFLERFKRTSPELFKIVKEKAAIINQQGVQDFKKLSKKVQTPVVENIDKIIEESLDYLLIMRNK